ncbi:DUF368 domain-containing protein [Microbacterium sp.]|uniref:DUF368 domain-containing protein n=1 Tax=Microbacterium sp. TaxID=51671 RepID=UPI003A8C61D9
MVTPVPAPQTSRRGAPAAVLTAALNAVRGALIGLAELLPGISGGTIALVTGVYERIIDSASHLLAALKRLAGGPDRRAGCAAELRRVDWWLVVPLVLGMAAMVFTLAGMIEGLVSAHPEAARGLFFGLIAASVPVPLMLIPRAVRTARSRVAGVVVFAAAAVIAFSLVGLSGGAPTDDPPLWGVFLAASVAVCALVLPGVSGSFFLLAVGLYAPTLVAVDQRDLAYLGVFVLGALVGLVTIVQVMKRLLDHHRRLTLLAMAGLMLGSLRALWPWQTTPAGDAHGVGAPVLPYDPVWGPVLWALAGAAVVAVLVAVERMLQRRATAASVVVAPVAD